MRRIVFSPRTPASLPTPAAPSRAFRSLPYGEYDPRYSLLFAHFHPDPPARGGLLAPATAASAPPGGLDRPAPAMLQLAAGVPRPKPAPPSDAEVERIYQWWRAREADGRRRGNHLAADSLQRFLDGSGERMTVDPGRLRQYRVVRDAEAGMHRHFTDWMTAPARAGTSFERIAPELSNLADGESITRSSHWDRKLVYDRAGLLGAFIDRDEATPSADLYASFGRSTLRGEGRFTFTRRGDEIYFRGPVKLHLLDRYDWSPGGLTPLPGDGSRAYLPRLADHDEALLLQQRKGAKPFDQYSEWWQYATGVLARDASGRPTVQSVKWIDHRPGGRPR